DFHVTGVQTCALPILEEIQNLILENRPDIIIANVKDKDSLLNLTSQCTILMNAVGPFNWYGKKVVEACIENNTHYLDITGEPSRSEERRVGKDGRARG